MKSALRTQVLLVLAMAALLPSLVIGGLAIYRARADVETEVVRGRLAHVRALASSLDQTLQGGRRSLELAAAWWADERDVHQSRSEESRRTMDRLWRRLHREVPLFSQLSILDVDGNTIFGEALPVDKDLGAHSFGGLVGDVVFDDGHPYVPIVTQARSRTGERIGVLVARLDLSFVTDTLSNARLGPKSKLFVVDGRGNLIAASDGSRPGSPSASAPSRAVVNEALGRLGEGTIDADGTLSIYRNLVAFQDRRAVPWAIILEQPIEEAFALARKTGRDTAVVTAVVLLLVLVIGAALASRLTRPLHLLARHAEAVGEGDEQSALPVDAPGEIGVLARRFEDMAAKIAERERLQSALAHEDRLATVGTMAASVAHEVNNPLTTILGYSNFLMEDKEEDDPDRSSLQLIASEATRMKAIVGNMLDYARTESNARGPTDLNRVLERSAALVAPAMKKSKATLELDLSEESADLLAGEQQLLQIFVNLVQNAHQAMQEGGLILLRSRVEKDNGRAVVCVIDEGPGIPEDKRSKVFEAFYTTKETGKGTGLGLAVVKHLVSEFRGTIDVLPREEERGTCMKVVIPIARTAEEELAPSHPDEDVPTREEEV